MPYARVVFCTFGWSEGVIPAHDTTIAYHRRAKMSIFFFSIQRKARRWSVARGPCVSPYTKHVLYNGRAQGPAPTMF